MMPDKFPSKRYPKNKWDHWERHFMMMMEAGSYPEKRRLQLLECSLTDWAHSEFCEAAPEIRDSFNQMMKYLRQRLARYESEEELRRKFFELFQRPGEPCGKFACRIKVAAMKTFEMSPSEMEKAMYC